LLKLQVLPDGHPLQVPCAKLKEEKPAKRKTINPNINRKEHPFIRETLQCESKSLPQTTLSTFINV
jgi:hypothetical protein